MGLKEMFKKSSEETKNEYQYSSMAVDEKRNLHQQEKGHEILTKTPYRPKDMPGLSPYLLSPNPEKLSSFLQSCYGFEPIGTPIKTNGEVAHLEMRMWDSRIMIGREGAWQSKGKCPKSMGSGDQGTSLYLYVPDVDAHFERAQNSGAEIMSAPQETFWGDRIYSSRDSDGYIWVFATNVKPEEALQ